jgi:hypothetical protein
LYEQATDDILDPLVINGQQRREIRLLLSVDDRNIARTVRDCRRSSNVVVSSSSEMKRRQPSSEFERHRSAEFVIYRCFDGVKLATTHRYVVRTDVDDAGNSTVLAIGVTNPQKRGPGVADQNVGFDVAVDVQEI